MVNKLDIFSNKIFFFNLIKKQKGSHNLLNPTYFSTVHSNKCTQYMKDAQEMTNFINEGYMRLKPLLYPCTIEFSLMCLTVNISRLKKKENHLLVLF